MDDDILQSYKEAGRIAKDCREWGAEQIRVGASMKDVLAGIEQRIWDEDNTMPAFPPQISVNNVAAHFYPGEDDYEFKDGDLCKLDVGVAVNGYIADTATTVDLGDHDVLVDAAEDALDDALDIVGADTTLSEIGGAIEDAVTSHDVRPVTNLSGHGLARFDAHTPPTVPNVTNGNQNTIGDDTAIAIEPFTTDGAGEVYEGEDATVFEQVGEGNARNQMVRKVLKQIESYEGLPFATRWIADEHGWAKTRYALRELHRLDIVKGYPPLKERRDGNVAQAEHTVVIADGDVHITTR
jgi:methionyl aminopeptidase